MTKVLDQVTQIARVCHEANRAYCETLGDTSQKPWDVAPGWQQTSAIMGVNAIKSGEVTSPIQSHISWMAAKTLDGWKYGPVKDEAKKEHHCMVPYEQLPGEQRLKDAIFFAVATAMLNASN